MKKLLFIINASGGKGKDSFCDYIKKYSGHDTFTISSVDEVKDLGIRMGWDGVSKTDKDRKFLAELKYLWSWYNDSPFNYVKGQIEYFYASQKKEIMFIHIREPKEIKKIKQTFPETKTILLQNVNVKDIITNRADASVYDYKYDYYLSNDDSLDDLKETALNFINRFYEDDNDEI